MPLHNALHGALHSALHSERLLLQLLRGSALELLELLVELAGVGEPRDVQVPQHLLVVE